MEIGLWKNEEQTDVRPIAIRIALCRLMCRAVVLAVRGKVDHLLATTGQLGVLRGGYETGVHAVRALLKECETTDEILLTLDFRNAFNTADRALMLNLVASLVPEVNLVFFFLKREQARTTSTSQAPTEPSKATR